MPRIEFIQEVVLGGVTSEGYSEQVFKVGDLVEFDVDHANVFLMQGSAVPAVDPVPGVDPDADQVPDADPVDPVPDVAAPAPRKTKTRA